VPRPSITCKISGYQDYTDNRDLDSSIHKGFTYGRGKVMYFMMIWHGSGHVTIHPVDDNKSPRWINGDSTITIHFRDEDNG
jgi:hypothetical protein